MNRSDSNINEILLGIRQDIRTAMKMKPAHSLALVAATCKPVIAIDGMTFNRIDGAGEDNGYTGSHSRIYEDAETRQQYRVTVEPVK